MLMRRRSSQVPELSKTGLKFVGMDEVREGKKGVKGGGGGEV